MHTSYLASAKAKLSHIIGRSIPWDIEKNIKALSLKSNYETPDGKTFSNRLNEIYYTKENPTFDLDGNTDHTAISLVPYFANTTELLIYNFFGQNYAIRDPILFRVVLIKNNIPLASNQFLLGTNKVKWINNLEDFLGIEEHINTGVILVSAHHPRISTRGREFRFFGLYRSAHGLAGCHSMPAGVTSLPKGHVSHRAIAPIEDIDQGSAFAIGLGAGKIDLITKNNIPNFASESDHPMAFATETCPFYSVPSYIVTTDDENNCRAIWHDGPASHFQDTKTRPPGHSRAAIGLPKFNAFAPKVLLSSNQIGQVVDKVSISLFSPSGQHIATQELRNLPTPNCMINLGSIFHKERKTVSDACVQFDFGFDSKPAPTPIEIYLHVYFQNEDKVLDQTHTLRTIGRAAEPNPVAKSYRARKFAPIFIGGMRRSAISINNVSPYGDLPETEFTLRFFLENGEEYIRTITAPKNRSILLWVDDLIKNSNEEAVAGVVWIEHESVNASAHWFIFDSHGGPATDHFTGG